jgi:hypothetical protein
LIVANDLGGWRRMHRDGPMTPVLPAIDQPGTAAEQLQAVEIFRADPTRKYHRPQAWLGARALSIEHVRLQFPQALAAMIGRASA